MAELADKIYKQALDLPIDDRLTLIDKLLISTNLPTQNDIDQAWSKEVERRCQELDSGKAKLIPGEEVFEKIKKRFFK
ncbi:MAG: addiction module protein [Proteobacteria bacterium]|nr:addiction module protein [Pseudomonadota bacterium]MBU4037642.1 addiction module protein [Pseudomonadota bacterium]